MATSPAASTPILLQIALSGASVSVANTCTIPLDVLKVRMQLQNAKSGGIRVGMIKTATSLFSTEGPRAFYNGLGPALARGVFYGGTRLGLYSPLRDAISAAFDGREKERSNRGGEASTSSRYGTGTRSPAQPLQPSFGAGLAAGCLSGCAAAALTNPIDLVKTRLQAPLPHPGAKRLSALDTARAVAAASPRGLLALWAGVGPSAARAAAQTASQCAAYDAAKRAWRRATGAEDGAATHLAASAATGLVTTTCTAPIDVVKTKMMVHSASSAAAAAGQQQQKSSEARGTRSPRSAPGAAAAASAPPPPPPPPPPAPPSSSSLSPWSVARDLVRAEGPTALLKGWTAQYVRLAPQSVITFLVLEQLRGLCGLPPL